VHNQHRIPKPTAPLHFNLHTKNTPKHHTHSNPHLSSFTHTLLY